MALPTLFLRDVLKSVLEDIGLDSNSRHESQNIAAHLLMSSLFRVTVHCNKNNEKKSFIFKTLRTYPDLNEKYNVAMIFRNECMLYTKILESFKAFQIQRLDKGIVPFQCFPKCYKAMCENEGTVIVLEDVTERGFVASSRFKSLELSELLILMRELGRFHALSLAIKSKAPDLFAELRSNAIDVILNQSQFDKFMKDLLSEIASWALNLAKESFPLGSPYVTKMETYAKNMPILMKDSVCPKEEDEQYNVFTHGDLWVNNLLFRYKDQEENGIQKKPDGICFVDFQHSRFGSVALDVSSVLFTLMDQEMRDSHRGELLQAYHSSLSEFLRQLGCEPERLFPFHSLESQLSKYSMFSLGMTIFCLSHNLVNEDDGDMFLTEHCVPNTTEACRKRILDVIQECVHRGYLGP